MDGAVKAIIRASKLSRAGATTMVVTRGGCGGCGGRREEMVRVVKSVVNGATWRGTYITTVRRGCRRGDQVHGVVGSPCVEWRRSLAGSLVFPNALSGAERRLHVLSDRSVSEARAVFHPRDESCAKGRAGVNVWKSKAVTVGAQKESSSRVKLRRSCARIGCSASIEKWRRCPRISDRILNRRRVRVPRCYRRGPLCRLVREACRECLENCNHRDQS